MNNSDWISKNSTHFSPLFVPDLTSTNTCHIDLSANNKEVEPGEWVHADQLHSYIFSKLASDQAIYGYGGYLEDREVYRRSPLFGKNNEEPRSIHLGIDVWVVAGTWVYLPLEGMIHSFNMNNQPGDYGPTIIMEHCLEGRKFYTLYGHLSPSSLLPLKEGERLKAGHPLCQIGEPKDNGQWPPHLHFQVIMDIGNKRGDFPGVCTLNDQEDYRQLCPDPLPFFQHL